MSDRAQGVHQHEHDTVDARTTVQVGSYAPLRETLFTLRWGIMAVLLAITIAWPMRGTPGPPLWSLIVIFVLYNAAITLLQRATLLGNIARWLPLLDLAVIAFLYYLDTEPAGVVFTLFVVALLSAAVTMSARMATRYTLVTLATVAVLAPFLPSWSTDHEELRLFSARLVMLALVGIGSAQLVQQISRGYEAAYAARLNAERLTELERLRASFITSISHDLNTPLTAINAGIGLLETSVAGQLQPDQVRLLQNARRNGQQLQLLIDDLLTYNTLKHQAFTLNVEPIDLREVVLDALEGVQTLLQAKGQVLTLELPPTLPVMGDRLRLEQVVSNVLMNAHKHTPFGTQIVLSAEVRETDIHLTIADNGPGIPADAHAAIFEPFQRFGVPANGSGLGLGIVKVIVELHGGQVCVTSASGGGTAFQIVLPQRPGAVEARDVSSALVRP
jgi:signal transduction histidine kinase